MFYSYVIHILFRSIQEYLYISISSSLKNKLSKRPIVSDFSRETSKFESYDCPKSSLKCCVVIDICQSKLLSVPSSKKENHQLTEVHCIQKQVQFIFFILNFDF